MLAVASAKGISGSTVTAAWKRTFPDVPMEVTDKEKESLTIQTEGVSVIAMAVPLPIPVGDVDSACDRSWMWPDAARGMKRQRAHLIIAATPVGDVVREALAVTRAAAAFCASGDPAGVYWGSAGLIHEPAMFIEIAQGPKKFGLLPVTLWVNTILSAAKGGLNLTTEGMKALGRMEFEVVGAKSMDEKELRMAAYDLILHSLNSGAIFNDGDSFGREAGEAWKIEYALSKFRKGLRVMRVAIP